MKIFEDAKKKMLTSENYNFVFDKETGFFARWGKTKKDDPQMSPFGCEILDLEISSGKCSGRCSFCYKGNGEDENSHHMTFEEFKTIFHKVSASRTLTQIAFGICDVDSNPDFFKMMEYSRENGVVPNYTCNGLKVTDEVADQTAKLCGAVAVSLVNKEKTFETIRKFLSRGMTQCNIHYMLSNETYDKAFEIVDELSSDPTLKGFNAIVFLQYKPKGNNIGQFSSVLDISKYKALTKHCENKGIRYGFDSCSGPIFIESLLDTPDREFVEMFVEPCESGLFSSYINCYGKFFVCSFSENEDEWKDGIDVMNCDNFLKDVWHHPRLVAWRERLISKNRACPIYDLAMEKV